jgi:hypothetical protein
VATEENDDLTVRAERIADRWERELCAAAGVFYDDEWRKRSNVGHMDRVKLILAEMCAVRMCAFEEGVEVGQSDPSLKPARKNSDLVTCSLRYPDWVCHLPHTECGTEVPHHIDACGRFLPKRAEARG